MSKDKVITVLALILSAALARVFPHWPNFTPIVAFALFGGMEIQNRYLSISIIWSAMFLSDAILGFHPVMWATYIGLGGIVFIGHNLNNRAISIAYGSFCGSTLFFIVSNFGVWFSGILYPRTILGLAECYIAAVPFFGFSLLGDLFYCALIFSIYHILELSYIRRTNVSLL